MPDKSSDLVQGTLDMLVLKTLALEPMHGIVFRQGAAMLAAGLFFGILCALGLATVTEHVLGGFGAPDALTYLGVAILISLATLLACYIPARRATEIDPMVALRYE